MGVAKIISHSGAGLYAVELQYRIDKIIQKRKELETLVNELDEEYLRKNEELDDLNVEHDDALAYRDFLIENPPFPLTGTDIKEGITDPEAKKQNDIRKATRVITDLFRKIVETEEIIALNEIKYAPTKLNFDLYDEHSTDQPLTELWCIDYTLDLKPGDYVETLEVNDEHNDPNELVNIRPVFANSIENLEQKILLTGRIQKTELDEGIAQIEHVLGSEPWTIAWNWMTQPAMQKWRPQYRKGRITAINYSAQTCRVTYQNSERFSSVEPFPVYIDELSLPGALDLYEIEPTIVEEDVPFDYMNCGADVFKPEDYVIVEYLERDYTKPVVIGFVENPKRCDAQYLVYIDDTNERLFAEEIGNTGTFLGTPPIDLLQSESTLSTDNLTSGRRLNYGQYLTEDENGAEIRDIYTFKKYTVYKNGVELDVPVSFEQYIVDPFESNGVNLYNGASYVVFCRIIAVEVFQDVLYVCTYQGLRETLGLRIFEFRVEDLHLRETTFISLINAIYVESSLPHGSGSSPAKYYYFNEFIDPNANYPANGPNGGQLGTTRLNWESYPSKIYGFSISQDYILVSFSMRHVNTTSSNLARATTIITIDRTAGIILGHNFKQVADISVDERQGSFFPNEQETDKCNYDPVFDPDNENIDGEVLVKGPLFAPELETDTFASVGEVIN